MYRPIVNEHFENNRQMAFVSGPRQVGKTTLSKSLADKIRYLNWDDMEDRQNIIRGQQYVADHIGRQAELFLVFDELHKYSGPR